MKCLFPIFALLSVVSAQLGNECSVGADCGRGQDLICVHGKCIRLEPFGVASLRPSRTPSARSFIPHGWRDFRFDNRRRIQKSCGGEKCGIGFHCEEEDKCIFHPFALIYDFFYHFAHPCEENCEESGQQCVLGECQ